MPRSVDHDARRSAIDNAVIAIASESGFAAVTVRAVSLHIGSSTSVVTHYVKSRNDMLRNAVRSEVDARITDADAAIGSREGSAGLRALLEWAVLGPVTRGHRFWLAAVLGSATQPLVRAELDRFNTWWATRVRGLLSQTAVDDPDLAADTLNVLVDGLVVNSFYEGSPWVVKRRAALLDSIWNALGL